MLTTLLKHISSVKISVNKKYIFQTSRSAPNHSQSFGNEIMTGGSFRGRSKLPLGFTFMETLEETECS